MREIGGAAGVAAVATALVSRAGLDGFHAGFVLIAVVAVLGSLTAATAFQHGAQPADQPAIAFDAAGDPLVLLTASAHDDAG